jgi:hypothetical protein
VISKDGKNMARFSTGRDSLARLDVRIAALTNPCHRAWLSTYRNHWWGEVVGDVDAVMATMSRGPIRYSFDGHPFMVAEKGLLEVNNYENTRRMYQSVVDYGVNMAGPVDNERIFFDEQGLAVTCVLTTIYPGAFLTKHSEPVDPQGVYLARWPNVTVIRFDEAGLMMGEDIFNGAPLLVQQVDRGMIGALIDGPLPE